MTSLFGSLASNAGSAVPNAPDSPEAARALATGIVALHAFLRIEKDPQDRAAVTQCLAKLESIRGKKIGGSSGGNIPGY